MKKHIWLFFVLIMGIVQIINAQPEQVIRRAAQGKEGVSQDELVSFKSDVPYTKAIQSLGELGKKLDGKLLIDRSPMQGKDKPIGINIESMYWKDALELILRSNQLWYNDYPEYREIVSFEDIGKQVGEPVQKETPTKGKEVSIQPPAPSMAVTTPVDSSEYFSKLREITISTVIAQINRTKMNEAGVNFSLTRGRDLNLGVSLTGADKVISKAFSATLAPTPGKLTVDINAALNVFESDALVEIIGRPQITVRSGFSAKFQNGQDVSILQKDFSQNTVQTFYPTGTILTVRPKIYKIREIEFIDLAYNIEQSSVSATSSTTINKISASGSLSLLNGEEGYIGGMYSNDEETTREGVPLLKDLPWWVFGLRYLFGYDKKSVEKRELIVLMKAEILPLVEERAAQQSALKNTLLKDKLQEMSKDYERRTGKKME